MNQILHLTVIYFTFTNALNFGERTHPETWDHPRKRGENLYKDSNRASSFPEAAVIKRGENERKFSLSSGTNPSRREERGNDNVRFFTKYAQSDDVADSPIKFLDNFHEKRRTITGIFSEPLKMARNDSLTWREVFKEKRRNPKNKFNLNKPRNLNKVKTSTSIHGTFIPNKYLKYKRKPPIKENGTTENGAYKENKNYWGNKYKDYIATHDGDLMNSNRDILSSPAQDSINFKDFIKKNNHNYSFNKILHKSKSEKTNNFFNRSSNDPKLDLTTLNPFTILSRERQNQNKVEASNPSIKKVLKIKKNNYFDQTTQTSYQIPLLELSLTDPFENHMMEERHHEDTSNTQKISHSVESFPSISPLNFPEWSRETKNLFSEMGLSFFGSERDDHDLTSSYDRSRNFRGNAAVSQHQPSHVLNEAASSEVLTNIFDSAKTIIENAEKYSQKGRFENVTLPLFVYL